MYQALVPDLGPVGMGEWRLFHAKSLMGGAEAQRAAAVSGTISLGRFLHTSEVSLVGVEVSLQRGRRRLVACQVA